MDLSSHRQSDAWAENEKMRFEGLQDLTVAESLRQFADLQRAFAYQMEQAEPFVRPIRMKYLVELQERIRALNKLS